MRSWREEIPLPQWQALLGAVGGGAGGAAAGGAAGAAGAGAAGGAAAGAGLAGGAGAAGAAGGAGLAAGVGGAGAGATATGVGGGLASGAAGGGAMGALGQLYHGADTAKLDPFTDPSTGQFDMGAMFSQTRREDYTRMRKAISDIGGDPAKGGNMIGAAAQLGQKANDLKYYGDPNNPQGEQQQGSDPLREELMRRIYGG